MSLPGLIFGKRGASGHGFASTAEEVTAGVDLAGKTILITGVNSGIGAESARVLHRRGAHIVGLARSEKKAAEACAGFGDEATPVACDLAEPETVRAAVATVAALDRPLDVLMCNAGIMALPQRELVCGHERQFFTNHIGHFMLVTGLLHRLSEAGRVVVLSSAAHKWAPSGGIAFDDLTLADSYSPNSAYGQSKLANLLFARALAKRLPKPKQSANALHPGVIATNLSRHMNPVINAVMPIVSAIAMKSIPQGAATQCYVAVHPEMRENGAYFADCNVAKTSRHGRDDALAARLWEVSDTIVAEL